MSPPIKVAALLLPTAIMFDFGVIVQMFRRPPGLYPVAGAYELTVAGRRPGRVGTPDGVDVVIEHGLEALETADLVVVPGLENFDSCPPDDVTDALAGAHDRGARIASVCVGAFVLGFAGLLDGRRATTHWAATDRLQRRFPRCDVDPDVLYVDEGSVLTSAGFAAGLDLGLHIVRSDLGAARAADLARWNVVAPHRDGGQAQFIPIPAPAEPAALAVTLQWAQAHLDEAIDVQALARHAHVSVRTLARRFEAELGTTPKRWIHTQRVAAARELLETTSLNIDEIARRTGFASTASLRTHLRRSTALTPSRYRTSFAGLRERPLPGSAV